MFVKIDKDNVIAESIRSHLFISVGSKRKGILHCGNFHPEEVTLDDIYILKPRCTMRTNYHTFINPVHVKYNSTLRLSVIDQRDLKLYLNINNHVIRKVPNKSAHTKITGVKWNAALDYINETLQSHGSSLDYLPSTTLSIGLSTVAVIVVGVVIVVCLLRRYKRLKLLSTRLG